MSLEPAPRPATGWPQSGGVILLWQPVPESAAKTHDRHTSDSTIVVASWNVLAEQYLWKYRSRGGYRGVASEAPGSREARVVMKVAELASKCDAIVLQEATAPLVSSLRGAGLQVGFALRAPGKPDGLAWIAGPRLKQADCQVHPIPLEELGNPAQLSDGRAPPPVGIGRCWIVLTGSCAGIAVRIIGTHLVPDRAALRNVAPDAAGAAQVGCILEGIPEVPGILAIMVGDLNCSTDGSAIRALAAAGFEPVRAAAPEAAPTAAADTSTGQRWTCIDWVLTRGSPHGRGRPTATLAAGPLPSLPLPNTEMPSDHLPLEASISFACRAEEER